MRNADCVNGNISDEKLKETVRENSSIQKLAVKNFSTLSRMNICFYLRSQYQYYLDVFSE